MIDKNDLQNDQENNEEKWRVGRPGVFNSLWGAVLVPVVFGYAVFSKLDTSFGIKIVALIAIWWLILLVFWVLPIFSYFDAEKKWISHYKLSAVTTTEKLFVSSGFYFFYWPIYVPKEIVFWCSCVIVAIYYLRKYIGD